MITEKLYATKTLMIHPADSDITQYLLIIH